MKYLIYFCIFFAMCSCSSDEPDGDLTIDDLLYTSWTGKQIETMEDGNVRKINFIILFSSEKKGVVTYLDSTGIPVQNYHIYYRIEGNIMFLKGAFDGDYRIISHKKNSIEMEAYLPNHSTITLSRKK